MTDQPASAEIRAACDHAAPCPYCGRPETADHWRRISAGWQRVAWSAAITALIVGCGVGFVIGWAAFT